MLKQGWRGYVFSRSIGGSIIPHRVQNLVIRDCAQKHQYTYLLSAVEYSMPNCYMMLKALMLELNHVAGVIFYATHLLPQEDLFRREIYQGFLENGKGLHFALEDMSITKEEDVALIEDIILCRRLAARPGSLLMDERP